nr:unnamed protein product [Naegleria fowleri]
MSSKSFLVLIIVIVCSTISALCESSLRSGTFSNSTTTITELDHNNPHTRLASTIHTFLQNYHDEYKQSQESQQQQQYTLLNTNKNHHLLSNSFPSHSPNNKKNSRRSSSCVAVQPSIESCGGMIANNVSTLVANSLSFYKAQVTNSIDNFVEKVKSNYNGEMPSGCEASARSYFCSATFRHCLEDSEGQVEIEKPCQYICMNLYLNCIKEKTIALKSADHYCGTIQRPSDAYAQPPICTDVYMDRAMSDYLAMGLTLLGNAMLCGGVCSVSLCVCMAMNWITERRTKRGGSNMDDDDDDNDHQPSRDSIVMSSGDSSSPLPFHINSSSYFKNNHRTSLLAEQIPFAFGSGGGGITSTRTTFGSVDLTSTVVVDASSLSTTPTTNIATTNNEESPKESSAKEMDVTAKHEEI